MDLGERTRTYRVVAGMTQEELGDRIGACNRKGRTVSAAFISIVIIHEPLCDGLYPTCNLPLEPPREHYSTTASPVRQAERQGTSRSRRQTSSIPGGTQEW